MKYNKGFAPLVVLLIVLGVLAVGGVAYFAGKSSSPKNEVTDNSNYFPTTEQNYTPPTTNNNPPAQTPPPANNPTTPEPSGLPAPIFTTNSATNITSSSATLNASILGLMDPLHGTGQQSYFQYGTSSTNLSLTSSISGPTQGSLTKVVSGLQSNTTYYFRVAINYGPNSVPPNSHQYGNILSFKTQNIQAQNNPASSCTPQPYTGQGGGNSSFLANGINSLNIAQSLNSTLGSGVSGIKVLHFQLNGPWNSCDMLKKVTVHHLGTGTVSDIDKIYITDGAMNILTPVQGFYGNQSATLTLTTPFIIPQSSYNNDFYVVINTAIGASSGTHQIAIYPDNDGASDFVFSPIGHIVAGAENIISTSFTIIP